MANGRAPDASTTLAYRSLVDAYYGDLVDRLRGGPDLAILESWVPDDDLVLSLLSMIESAAGAGADSLRIRLDEADAAMLDESRLRVAVESLGSLRMLPEPDGAMLQVVLGEFDGASELPSGPYAPALRAAARSARLAGRFELPRFAANAALHVAENEFTLAVAVDGAGVVEDATYSACSEELRGMFECLCRELIGRPVREGAEHAILRVEASLRPAVPPSAGIVLAERLDPAFAVGARAARELLSVYLRAGGRREPNFYAEGPREAWSGLDEARRIARLLELARALVPAADSQMGELRIVEAADDGRVIVDAADFAASDATAKLLFDFERAAQSAIDPAIQIFCPEQRDDNAPRKTRDDSLQAKKAA